jgi:glutathione S-transferase
MTKTSNRRKDMSDFVIHGHPASPFLRSVCVALAEKGVPYSIQMLTPGEMRSAAFRQLHPFGRMPVIEHAGYRLYETQAILRYIDALFPNPALQPTEPQAIGRMNQIIGINDWYLFPQVARIIVFHRIVGPKLLGTAPDEAACAAALPDAELCLGELDRLLGKQAFFAGDRLTLADIHLAPQLFYLAATPECGKILKGTALMAWLERIEARPSMQATLVPEELRKAA